MSDDLIQPAFIVLRGLAERARTGVAQRVRAAESDSGVSTLEMVIIALGLVAVATLLDGARSAPHPSGARSPAMVLLDAWLGGFAQLYAVEPRAIRIAGDRPLAAPVARWQSAQRETVTNLRHEAVRLVDPFARTLLSLCDGTRSRSDLARAIAGERDKGTLEVTLSRPISRNGLLLTLYLAGLIFIGILVAVLMVSSIITTYAVGLGHELQLANTVQLWLVAWLLFAAFMSLTFAVSVGSDRAAPAFGIPATIILLSYLVWAIASIWPDVRWLGEYTVFHLVKAQETLDDGPATADVLILLGLSVVFMGIALYRFPRRDLPAPS